MCGEVAVPSDHLQVSVRRSGGGGGGQGRGETMGHGDSGGWDWTGLDSTELETSGQTSIDFNDHFFILESYSSLMVVWSGFRSGNLECCLPSDGGFVSYTVGLCGPCSEQSNSYRQWVVY